MSRRRASWQPRVSPVAEDFDPWWHGLGGIVLVVLGGFVLPVALFVYLLPLVVQRGW